MFTKNIAIKKIKEIQNSTGGYKNNFPDRLKGGVAKHFWDDPSFGLGYEYGMIGVLIEIFDIKIKDLK